MEIFTMLLLPYNRQRGLNAEITEANQVIATQQARIEQADFKKTLPLSALLVLEQGEDGYHADGLREAIVDEANCSWEDADGDIKEALDKKWITPLNDSSGKEYHVDRRLWRELGQD